MRDLLLYYFLPQNAEIFKEYRIHVPNSTITGAYNHIPNPVEKVSNGAKIRNRYNQVPHLTQDTNGKVTNSQKTPQTRAKIVKESKGIEN